MKDASEPPAAQPRRPASDAGLSLLSAPRRPLCQPCRGGRARRRGIRLYRAATPVESLICRDADLATLDVELARAYRAGARTAAGTSETKRLIADENAWIKSRARCASAGDTRGCVQTAYQAVAVLRAGQ